MKKLLSVVVVLSCSFLSCSGADQKVAMDYSISVEHEEEEGVTVEADVDVDYSVVNATAAISFEEDSMTLSSSFELKAFNIFNAAASISCDMVTEECYLCVSALNFKHCLTFGGTEEE